MKKAINVCWFRRDLRLADNAALYHALKSGLPVLPVFVFDRTILDELEEKDDSRVTFIYSALEEMQKTLASEGASLEVYHDTPEGAFKQLLGRYHIEKVFANHDYEPYASKRDAAVAGLLKEAGASLHTYKDQVIFEKDEVVKDDGKPYLVFTPYSRRWKALVNEFYLRSYPAKQYFQHLFKQAEQQIPSLESMGFLRSGKVFPPRLLKGDVLRHYREQRDYPAVQGTSHLGVHLRFGTVSIRQLATKAAEFNETFLNELIWREFYQMILWHFPKLGQGASFKKEYDGIAWRNNEQEFERWCNGMTGYPIVDAGMRELNTTGFMHNRVRMIVASFLAKHLLIDWRWGEAWFAKKLLDFDLASNNGGWQWAAGSGCDAAPYFRVFNPYLQTQKFDPELKYVRKWVSELDDFSYPQPIVEHEYARKRALEAYKKALRA